MNQAPPVREGLTDTLDTLVLPSGRTVAARNGSPMYAVSYRKRWERIAASLHEAMRLTPTTSNGMYVQLARLWDTAQTKVDALKAQEAQMEQASLDFQRRGTTGDVM